MRAVAPVLADGSAPASDEGNFSEHITFQQFAEIVKRAKLLSCKDQSLQYVRRSRSNLSNNSSLHKKEDAETMKSVSFPGTAPIRPPPPTVMIEQPVETVPMTGRIMHTVSSKSEQYPHSRSQQVAVLEELLSARLMDSWCPTKETSVKRTVKQEPKNDINVTPFSNLKESTPVLNDDFCGNVDECPSDIGRSMIPPISRSVASIPSTPQISRRAPLVTPTPLAVAPSNSSFMWPSQFKSPPLRPVSVTCTRPGQFPFFQLSAMEHRIVQPQIKSTSVNGFALQRK